MVFLMTSPTTTDPHQRTADDSWSLHEQPKLLNRCRGAIRDVVANEAKGDNSYQENIFTIRRLLVLKRLIILATERIPLQPAMKCTNNKFGCLMERKDRVCGGHQPKFESGLFRLRSKCSFYAMLLIRRALRLFCFILIRIL